MGDIWFVTGGARSGKSRYAERLALETTLDVVYIATMEPHDDELRQRVERHRADRPATWQTIEAPLDPAAALRSIDGDACALLDCLSLWVANRLMALGDEPSSEVVGELESGLQQDVDALIAAAEGRSAPTVIVTNEVGSGVVPEYALGRIYRDLLGLTNQRVAARATRAWLMASGRALELPRSPG
ncbi:MAG TPA: bifunctional adenosylcobinamide kinase/adenosylcobinamide-phosphate guanylyltransferase [Dehalococcoidia bacterium]|nr:bifunctional adenosylcobinamide kinase/adenosylcobinamide-phosphate guanylyltransferase [Dehalococcoidia bacterium]